MRRDLGPYKSHVVTLLTAAQDVERSPVLAKNRISRWLGRQSFVLRFALVSVLLVGLIAAVLTTWLAGVIRSSNIAAASGIATYSMGLTVGEIDAKAGGPAQISAAEYAQVTHLLRSMVSTGHFVGATAWSSPSLVAYAVEPGRTGRSETSRIQVAEALAGRTVTVAVHAPLAGVPDLTERAGLRQGPLLEIFTPVRINGHVVAAVEFYQPLSPVERQISHDIRQMLLLVGAGLLVLWAGLLSLVLSASHKVRKQSAINRDSSLHDALTGLPNRRLLATRVREALLASTRSGRSVGVLLLDLDRFKEVNDTLGHQSGDKLLQQVSERLTGTLRGDDSVARLGGDEFVVLLPEVTNVSDACAAADRITAALAEPFVVEAMSLDVEASIGVAVSPEHGTDFDTLLRHADIGMYSAKTTGSGVAVYAPNKDARSVKQLNMLGQLRRAVNDSAGFVLHYQPKAALINGEVQGFEALLRWQHPTDGLIFPSEFIPLAEQTGLIVPLTSWILREAIVQSRAWREAGIEVPLAVNVSARSLLDSNLPAQLRTLLTENDVRPEQLELELTEGVIMSDPEKAKLVLGELKALGVRLTIDDFGSGYSSMTRLKDLPVHQLKVDQSFVTQMTPHSADAAIVRSCIELGRNLGMTVIAEGVETAYVWNQLTELGCDQAQGYYLARPMPAAAVPGWIRQRSRTSVDQRIPR
jgi:diguanylate cyclase (GGDEF)-like protein